MFKVTNSKWSVSGVQNDYLCSSESDIDHLPKFGVRGTQEEIDEMDKFANEPCMYGSTALVVDPSLVTHKLYVLGADNVWTEFK